MAHLQRHAADALINSLEGKQCCGYDFFRVVRMIQASRRDLPVIGCSKTPEDDPIRFCQRPSLSFAASTLDELVISDDGNLPPRLYVNFMGLFGPNGPLPLHLTEYAIRRAVGQTGTSGGAASTDPRGHKDPAFSEFFDIFHHRMISLFFRAWSAAHPIVDLDRDGDQRFLFFLGAFFGESNGPPENRAVDHDDMISLREKVYYAGRLSCPTRNAEGLEEMVHDYFHVPTKVQQFVGRWFNLPEYDGCRLGKRDYASKLGENVIVGSRTWTANLSVRLRMGPMGFADYLSLLPLRENHFLRLKSRFPLLKRRFPLLKSWVENYCGAELFWDLQLVLHAGEAEAVQLGRAGMLGWTTWLKAKPLEKSQAGGEPETELDDLILVPPETFN